MISKIILTLIIVILLPAFIAASGNITGKVSDKDGQPLMGVSVSTNITGVGTISDENGNFTISKTDGVTRLTFSSIGYKPVQYLIENLPDQITLQSAYYKTESIIVTGDRAVVGLTPIAFDNLSAEEIKRDYTVGEFPLLLASTPNLYSYPTT